MLLNKRFTGLLITLVLLVTAGCAKKYIPNTTLEDSPFHRKIVKFCEQYRLAVESKNIGKLLMLASPDYYEDGGTPTGGDDFDYAELRDILVARFEKVKTIRYDVKYRKITLDGSLINVDYTWSGSYQITGPSGQDYWFRKVEDNRLVLVEYKDSYKILSGM
jgi:hypothetical protein